MTRYSWNCIPELHGKMPQDPEDNWNLNDYYDHPIGWHEEYKKYQKEIIEWKITQLQIIQGLSEQQLLIWKAKYNTTVKLRKHVVRSTNVIPFEDDEREESK